MSYIIGSDGSFISLDRPHPSQLSVDTIAHSLSCQGRWVGHASKFYSVAEHSVFVAQVLRDHAHSMRECRAALFHDAHEAVFGDISSPMKSLLGHRIERLARRWDETIASIIDVEPWMFENASWADHLIWCVEAYTFFPKQAHLFAEDPGEAAMNTYKPLCMNPSGAEDFFMSEWRATLG